MADATLPLLRGAERDIARLAGGTAGKAKRLGEKGLFATLYAGIRADMRMRDFLLTAKNTSFSTLDGVSAVR